MDEHNRRSPSNPIGLRELVMETGKRSDLRPGWSWSEVFGLHVGLNTSGLDNNIASRPQLLEFPLRTSSRFTVYPCSITDWIVP